jgi:hypothetical protein
MLAIAALLVAAAPAHSEATFSFGSPRFESKCVGIRNSHECAQRIERAPLAASASGVEGDGNVLRLAIDSDRSVELTDVTGFAYLSIGSSSRRRVSTS